MTLSDIQAQINAAREEAKSTAFANAMASLKAQAALHYSNIVSCVISNAQFHRTVMELNSKPDIFVKGLDGKPIGEGSFSPVRIHSFNLSKRLLAVYEAALEKAAAVPSDLSDIIELHTHGTDSVISKIYQDTNKEFPVPVPAPILIS